MFYRGYFQRVGFLVLLLGGAQTVRQLIFFKTPLYFKFKTQMKSKLMLPEQLQFDNPKIEAGGLIKQKIQIMKDFRNQANLYGHMRILSIVIIGGAANNTFGLYYGLLYTAVYFLNTLNQLYVIKKGHKLYEWRKYKAFNELYWYAGLGLTPLNLGNRFIQLKKTKDIVAK